MESPNDEQQYKYAMALQESQWKIQNDLAMNQWKIGKAKGRDRALLLIVFITLAVAMLSFGRGLWYHDMTMIEDGVIYAAGVVLFYFFYRKMPG